MWKSKNHKRLTYIGAYSMIYTIQRAQAEYKQYGVVSVPDADKHTVRVYEDGVAYTEGDTHVAEFNYNGEFVW
jgi:hypothetical protein